MDHRSRNPVQPLRETVPDLRESLGAMIEDAKQAALNPGIDRCLAAAKESVDHAAEVINDLVAAAQSFISLFDHDLPECFVGASMGAVRNDS